MKSVNLPTLLFVFASVVFLSSCDTAPTGDYTENEPPSTFLTLESINREGDFRLSSQINISWWGTDSDGYIIGYEYAINDTSEGSWFFTEKTDSTFILPITEGNVEDDVLFKVRAIDNDGAMDEDGASLVFPIINSDPTVILNSTETPPDTLFGIASFGWSIFDVDGIGNIQRTEIAINDTTGEWTTIPIPEGEEQVFISLEVDNSSTGSQTADVFIGRSYSTLEEVQVPGIEVGQINTFYVRAIDFAGAVSNIDSVSWYAKPQISRTLLLNDYSGSGSLSAQNFHLQLLSEIGITPDIWIINDKEVEQEKVALSDAFPTVTDPTLKRTLEKWDHIYWVSNDIDRNITYAQDLTSRFFDNNGTMFVNIPMKGIGQNDEIFNFIPVDSIGVLSGIQTGFIINSSTPALAVDGHTGAELLIDSQILGNYPLKPVSGSTLLYETDFRATTIIGTTQDYQNFEGIVIENAEANLIYVGADMQFLNGNDNLDQFLNELLIGRLNFKQ